MNAPLTHAAAPAPRGASAHPPVTTWDLLLACFSVYVLGVLAVELLFELPGEVSLVLHIADHMVCGIFLIDFFRRLLTAPNKLAYMKWGWIDLLASIPAWEGLRWGRAVGLARILLVLRAIRSVRLIWRVVRHDFGKSIVALTFLATVFTLIASSILILSVETAEKSNIRTAMDALWWSLTTVTTVGYGDHFPVTVNGRLVAAVLMALGIALYGTFTAFVSGKILELSSKHRTQREAAEVAAGSGRAPKTETDVLALAASDAVDLQLVLTELRDLRVEISSLRAEMADLPRSRVNL